MTHRNTSKTRSKTAVELRLGRRVRLPAIADFELCKLILFKASENAKTDPSTFIIWKRFQTAQKLITDYSSERQLNCATRWGQCENWTTSGGVHITSRTRTSEHRCGTFTTRWSFCNHIVCRASTEHLPTSTKHGKQPDRFVEPISTNLPKKRGRWWFFQGNIKNSIF